MEPQAAADSSPSAARSLTQKAASWVLRASSSMPAIVPRSSSRSLNSKVEPVPLVAISGKALEEYHDLFAMMDQDGSGDVSLDELKVMFKNMQIRVADSEIKSIVIAMDADKSGTVSFPGEARHPLQHLWFARVCMVQIMWPLGRFRLSPQNLPPCCTPWYSPGERYRTRRFIQLTLTQRRTKAALGILSEELPRSLCSGQVRR